MGGPDFRGLAASFETFGEDGLDLLLQAASGGHVGQVGAPRAHDRAVHRDLIEVLGLAASHWPQRFAELVAADAHLRRHSRFLWALGWADCDLSAQLLIDAAGAADACDQYTRWCALKSLERLANRALPDVLTSLINDEAELLRGAAVAIAIGYGDARLVSDLHRIALADRTPPGTRAAAWDAIEAIKIRERLTGAPTGPHTGLLVPVNRPAGGETAHVLSLDRLLTFDNVEVHGGQRLAIMEAGAEHIPVQAPCSGRIVSNLMAPGRPAPPVLAWIRAHVPP